MKINDSKNVESLPNVPRHCHLYLDNVNYTFGKLSPGLEQFLSEVEGTLPMSSSSLQQGIPASWLIKCPGLQLSS